MQKKIYEFEIVLCVWKLWIREKLNFYCFKNCVIWSFVGRKKIWQINTVSITKKFQCCPVRESTKIAFSKAAWSWWCCCGGFVDFSVAQKDAKVNNIKCHHHMNHSQITILILHWLHLNSLIEQTFLFGSFGLLPPCLLSVCCV